MENELYKIELIGSKDCLWRYTVKGTGREFDIAPPVFRVDRETRSAILEDIKETGNPEGLPNGATEYTFSGSFGPGNGLTLDAVFRVASDNPVVRFRYTLRSNGGVNLTKKDNIDDLEYLTFPLDGLSLCKEVTLSEFDRSAHTYHLFEHDITDAMFDNVSSLMGPIIAGSGDGNAVVAAYEHGSQTPDAFLKYHLKQNRNVSLRAEKGNYYHGCVVDGENPYETIWLQFGAVEGDEDTLAAAYRDFVLRYMTVNAESRKPYIFYNTWCFQERNEWWNDRTYLADMNRDRMLEEIDVAHRMGVDVFVIDTGWYEKCGDWEVDKTRFPDGLEGIKKKLGGYGMNLGLWFSPTKASVSSSMLKNHLDCKASDDDAVGEPFPVWGTEESYEMCLVSRYWDAFSDELIRLVKELGVTYFKWDAIGQYCCSGSGHLHGTKQNSVKERSDCYAFGQVRHMVKVIDKLCSECPEAIVDFDVTEARRSVGLAFLSAGKYFLINNGPYFNSFDNPVESSDAVGWSNIFVYPGPARGLVCRRPLDYDRWIPSILFLTHYIPDDPESSQIINLASLVLGHNGIWGDLPEVSDEGVALFGKTLEKYKQVRDDITTSDPVRYSRTGGSPEVHEKISSRRRGAVAVFGEAGVYEYITAGTVDEKSWTLGDVQVERLEDGRARITVTLTQPGAGLVFFGVE